MQRANFIRLSTARWVRHGGVSGSASHAVTFASHVKPRHASTLSLSRDKLFQFTANDVASPLPSWQALWTRLLTTDTHTDLSQEEIANLPRQKLADLCEEIHTPRDCHKLLLWLHFHPQSLTQGHDISRRVLPKLLSLQHYAGAREVIEAILLVGDASTLDVVAVNHILAAVFLRDYSRTMSVAFANAIIQLLVYAVGSDTHKVPYDRDTTAILLAQPHCHDITTIKACSELYLQSLARNQNGQTDYIPPDPQTIHYIMRAYALLGREVMVLHWKQILEHVQAQQYQAQIKSKEPHQLDRIYRKYLPKTARQTPIRDFDDVFLGTTLLAAYGRPLVEDIDVIDATSLDLEVIQEADGTSALQEASLIPVEVNESASPDDRARLAMHYFQQLRNSELGSPPDLDIHAWTAILGVAAQRGSHTPLRSITAVFKRLQDDPALPAPNIVTYTVYASALARRGRYEQAYALFADEVLPNAATGDIQLDAAAVQLLCGIIAELSDAKEALAALQFFCLEPDELKDETPLVLYDEPVSESLRGRVLADQSLINAVLTYLGAAHEFASFWRLYREASGQYGMRGDETTLSILAKAVITEASQRKSGTLPTHIDDVFAPPRARDQQISGDDSPSILNMLRGQRDRPHDYVRSIFWNMIHDNYPAAIQRAEQAIRSTTARILAAAWDGIAESDSDTSAYRFTRALQVMPATRAEEIREITNSAHWCATSSNIHMFVALLAYFGHSAELPLVLAFMREARLIPTRKTICLALWSMETNGAFTADLRKVKRFIGDWLGHGAVPGDDELADFHVKQWGPPRAPAT